MYMYRWKVFWLAILAGAYIGLGAAFFLSVGGQMPGVQSTNLGLQKLVLGAFGLPMSLGLILVCGAELLTANSAYISAAVFEVNCCLHLLNIKLIQNLTCKFVPSRMTVTTLLLQCILVHFRAHMPQCMQV